MTKLDDLITIYKDLAPQPIDSELEEQGADTTGGASAGSKPPPYPAVTKWETGVKRGSANQIGNTKWKDSYTITRGKANTLL